MVTHTSIKILLISVILDFFVCVSQSILKVTSKSTLTKTNVEMI